MIKMMLRDGSDPRIRNKDGHRAEDLVNPENTQLKKVFAEFQYEPPSDEEEEEEPASKKNGYDYADLVDGDEGDDDVGSAYSGSDSEEEQEWQRRRAEKSGK